MTADSLILILSLAALAALMAYVILGGADFGGGVWDLFAAGPRAAGQREAIAHAMGPVWEANHVWLIFLLVMLFTCFPRGYAVLSVTLFVPFHLALLGIMLRGAAFVFRAQEPTRPTSDKGSPSPKDALRALPGRRAVWQPIFGAASVITPFLLGSAFGTVTSGAIRVDIRGKVTVADGFSIPWLSPYAIGCGLLALSTCAFLAAVYLVVETKDELREDFRRRAIISGTATAVLAAVVLFLAYKEARWFFDRLVAPTAWPILALGVACFAASAWAVFRRKYRLAPIFAAGQIILLLAGWALAQRPYLIYPDVTFASAAAPAPTLRFMAYILPVGAILVGPSLWLLFHVFKRPLIRQNRLGRL